MPHTSKKKKEPAKVVPKTDWYADEDFRDAVKRFHDQHSRKPSKQDQDEAKAKEILQKLQNDLKKRLEEKKMFVCSRFEHRGSSYEGVKIKEPKGQSSDFDLMFIIEGGEDLTSEPVGQLLPGYHTLKPKSGLENRPVFQETLNSNGDVDASKLRNLFMSHMTKCKLENVVLRYNGPAIRVDCMQEDRTVLSVDFAPHFDLTKSGGGIFVPKAPHNNEQGLKASAWFRSYSLEEKSLLTGIDQDNGCRKQILRVLKVLRRIRCKELSALRSNQLKTVLLQEVKVNKSWKPEELGSRLIDVLKRLRNDLARGMMEHYYMKDVNLFKFSKVTMKNMKNRLRRLLRSKERMMTLLKMPDSTGET